MTALSSIVKAFTSGVQGYQKQNGSDGATSNTVFSLSNAYAVGSGTLLVFVNGQKAEAVTSATDTTEYEETNAYTITFGASLQDADVVETYVVGQYNLNQDTFDNMLTSSGVMGGFKNKIVNGNFDIWQRGTSHTGISASEFTADRFEAVFSNDGVITVSRDTDVPTQLESGLKSNYSLKIDVTTADATIAAAQYLQLRYIVEGYDFAPMMGKNCTLSFWVKSVKTGTYCVSFRNSVPDRSYIVEYTIDAANTWEKKTITLDFSDSTGTWDYTTGKGVWVTWALAAGTDWQSTANTWLSTNDFGTSNQVNFMDSTDNNFWISQVQFEIGAVATPFEMRQIAQEFAMCQRYYEKSFPIGTTPAHGESPLYGAAGMIANATDIYRDIYYRVEKRITPTVTFYASGYIGTTKWGWYDGSTWYEADANVVTASNSTGYTIKLSDTGLTKDVTLVCGNWTADAEF